MAKGVYVVSHRISGGEVDVPLVFHFQKVVRKGLGGFSTNLLGDVEVYYLRVKSPVEYSIRFLVPHKVVKFLFVQATCDEGL